MSLNILILAAGFGTRLQSFGESTPKGLVETKSGVLMSHIIDEALTVQGQTALVTNDRFRDAYTRWVSATYPDHKIQILSDGAKDPQSRIGALGDILFAIQQLEWEESDLLVIPSDTFFTFSLADFVSFALEEGVFATVVRDLGDPTLIANRLGCPTIRDERIVSFVEKPAVPPSSFAAIPFYFYPKKILHMLSLYKLEGNNMDAPGSIIPWLLEKCVSVAAYQTSGITLDVGTPEDIATARNL